MIKILLILLIFITQSCSKPKTVLICGDHICVNKKEANQYFEENLSIEVKIISRDSEKNMDLVQLNLKENSPKRQINIIKKQQTNEEIKPLSKKEIKKIKKKIKKHESRKKVAHQKTINERKKKPKIESNTTKKIKVNEKIVKSKEVGSTDVCTLLDKCSIDEISKYLIKEGKRKKFPDITTRE